MFGKKDKPNAWHDKARKLRRKGKLPAPYSTLLGYYDSVSSVRSVLDGHFDYFSNSKFNDELDDYVKDLRTILPQALLENFNTALDKFIALGEEPDCDDIVDVFFDTDEYADEHAEEIAELLKSYITEMEERHYF